MKSPFLFFIVILLGLFHPQICFAQYTDTVHYVEVIGFNQYDTIAIPPSDTTYLQIVLRDKKKLVKFKGNWQTLVNEEALSKMLRSKRDQINKEKIQIVIVAPSNTPYSEYSFIIKALKSLDILKFHFAPSD